MSSDVKQAVVAPGGRAPARAAVSRRDAMPRRRHRPSRRQRRTRGVLPTGGLLRTERFELHALNLTAEAWDTWLQGSHALPLAWRGSRCGLSGNAAALVAGLVWASQPGRSLIEAHCDALSSRAAALAVRPRLEARARPTLVNGTWYAAERGGTPRGAPRLLVVDPLLSGGVDQLTAIPTHAKRLSLAAARQRGRTRRPGMGREPLSGRPCPCAGRRSGLQSRAYGPLQPRRAAL